eukprot:TRINITY_DN11510_c0_g1_i1.p1 TRINITY_DN11510_c0_g1~~TRINITY_DN11510_c0_g1_i1.p1  ORF type:complete len:579 (+),score=155.98 TRINITY_DN11510_c0_g1_i1:44-1738(+)
MNAIDSLDKMVEQNLTSKENIYDIMNKYNKLQEEYEHLKETNEKLRKNEEESLENKMKIEKLIYENTVLKEQLMEFKDKFDDIYNKTNVDMINMKNKLRVLMNERDEYENELDYFKRELVSLKNNYTDDLMDLSFGISSFHDEQSMVQKFGGETISKSGTNIMSTIDSRESTFVPSPTIESIRSRLANTKFPLDLNRMHKSPKRSPFTLSQPLHFNSTMSQLQSTSECDVRKQLNSQIKTPQRPPSTVRNTLRENDLNETPMSTQLLGMSPLRTLTPFKLKPNTVNMHFVDEELSRPLDLNSLVDDSVIQSLLDQSVPYESLDSFFQTVFSNKKSVVCLVGGGGKTSLMHRLAKYIYKDRGCILTTTTHTNLISESSFEKFVEMKSPSDFPSIDRVNPGERVAILSNKKVKKDHVSFCGVDVQHYQQLLNLTDVILIEADGARRRPFKAPKETEPVIPDCTNVIINVIGLDALFLKVSECHRPEIICKFANVDENTIVNSDIIKSVIQHPLGPFKNCPIDCKRIIVINKADIDPNLALTLKDDLQSSINIPVFVVSTLHDKLYR